MGMNVAEDGEIHRFFINKIRKILKKGERK